MKGCSGLKLRFRDNKLEKAYQLEKERLKQFSPPLARKYHNTIALLEAAENLQAAYSFPHLNLHPLKGDKEGLLSITLHDRWRLILKQDTDDPAILIIWEVTNHYGD